MADRAAAEALRYDRPVELEPMRAPERKIVHLYLRERTDIDTHSEGDEPDRRLVLTPVRGIRGAGEPEPFHVKRSPGCPSAGRSAPAQPSSSTCC